MSIGDFSSVFTEQDYDDVLKAIKTFEDKMPFLITLTPAEKKSLPKFGDKSLPFVNKCLELATQHPEFLPRNFNVVEMGKDVNMFNKLFNILQSLNIIHEKIEDTFKETGAEAYTAALMVYSVAKVSGKNLGGMDAVLEELGKRFAHRNGEPKLDTVK